jgi:hypothetical protein
MSKRKRGTALRRAVTVLAGTTVLTAIGAGVAMADVSPTQVAADDTTLYWSGQGVPVQQLCGDQADFGAGGMQNGATANSYELWIFATDGGSVDAPPTLTINGTQYGNAFKAGPFTDSNGILYDHGAWQIVTPYIDPGTIAQANPKVQTSTGGAFTSFPPVTNPGGGSWVLTISHGCANTNPPPAAKALTIGKTAAGTFDTAYKWGISKNVDHSKLNTPGDATFSYTVTVTHDAGVNGNYQVNGDVKVNNLNSAPVAISGLTDSLAGGPAQDISGGATQVGPGITDFPYHFNLGDSPPSSATLDDTATVTWGDQTLTDTAGSVLKGDSASATANTGAFTQDKVSNQTVTVSDPLAPAGTFTQLDATKDAPSVDFPYQHTFSGDPAGTCTSHDNTATIDQTGQHASQTVKVCVGADLQVKKDATPAFDRTYTWGIAKAVDHNLFNLPNGAATANYTVNVTHNNGADSGWQVTGTIHVTNPNNWESVPLTGVTDTIDNGGTCVITSGDLHATLAAGATADLGYKCAYSTKPDYAALFTNTAAVTWDKGAASTPDGSANGTATGHFSDVSPAIHDGSVNVTDTLGGNLGKVSYTDPSPTSFTYNNIFQVPGHGCQSFPNTATFTTNDTGKTGSASQTVQVCRTPLKTGALTMGYWQNKNGQTQITTGTSTAGVCDSGTFLRKYTPFQDLSATATCAQVGTYVTNVIKAANASGATMNAMLKAQMLSTALDVNFNSSIGSAKIDLTQVCKMIDGSGGTATCSGTYENVSSAFGGATSMTVSDMLTFENSVSNSGGSTWYGNVKATQQLAKDAFDAINNQVAFGA